MPEFTELDFPIGYVSDCLNVALGTQSEPRAVGWHMTSIISAAIELARGKPINSYHYYWDGIDDPSRPNLVDEIPAGILEMGDFWEAASRPAFKQWCGQKFGLYVTGPVQVEYEGIIANADSLVLPYPGSPKVVAVGETKFRFSPDTNPLKQARWLRQIQGYCKVWDTNRVWMVVGNVRSGPPGSGSRVYEVTFAPHEIEENWTMIVRGREWLDRDLKKRYGATVA